MNFMKRLNELFINEEGVIKKVVAPSNIKNRLIDIGFVKGTKIKKVLVSPGKDMVAYDIKGAVIAIRKDDTKEIIVEVVS